MVDGSPDDRPDWVLKGNLAQGLAPPLDLQTQNEYPLTLAGLMQITHKTRRLSRTYRPNPCEGLVSSSH